MPIVGDFKVIHDGVQQLEAGDEVVFAFDLPEHLYNKAARPRGYVVFDYYLSKASRLVFYLNINGNEIDAFTGMNGTQLGHNMELIHSDWLKPGRNEFNISVEQGEGVLHLYETVINFHVEI
ncbi:MAG: hypothetical protein KQJ78_25740 [Deltaproteobacteria bacterium]|nr:hypothetical protein [Deltaproteobacteria bacterium]